MAGDDSLTYRRFSNWARFQHASVIVLFFLLLVTGLPQKWPTATVSGWLVDAMGGIFATRWLHRAVGVAFSLLVAIHLAVVIVGILAGRMKPTMVVVGRDFRDTIESLRHATGERPDAPPFGRYDYRQKFEYWGLVFGSLIMVATGFALLYPIPVARLLPAQVIPAAKVMHSYEAVFAFLIVVIWHLIGANLTATGLHFDTSIFTGRMRKARLRHEHPIEYEELFGTEESPASEPEVPPGA